MHDSYLLLTPLLTLLVVALVGFVGCDIVFSVDHVPDALVSPRNLVYEARDSEIILTWDAEPGADSYSVQMSLTSGAPYEETRSGITTNSYPWSGLTNGTHYFFVVRQHQGTRESPLSNEVDAVPAVPGGMPFVTAIVPGTLRNDLSGWAGMVVTVGPASLTLITLGRAYAPGNTGTHNIKIVDQATKADIPGSLVSVTMVPAVPGEFQYAGLPAPVTLDAGRTYYIVALEMAMADQFYDHNTVVQTMPGASVVNAVFTDTLGNYVEIPPGGSSYGPVNFQY